MKGVVFTEFLELVEDKFGYEMVDHIIAEAAPSNNGAYTSVGTYPFAELAAMLGALSNKTGLPPNDLLIVFGQHLFKVFFASYGHFFERINDPFDFLQNIESHIHVEVKKLYPDAELPTIACTKEDDKTLFLHYLSKRRLHALAHGLIQSTMEHFNTNATIKSELVNEDGSEVKFVITKILD